MKKKICIITSSYPQHKDDTRNAGIFVRDFALLLAKENYDVFVIAPQGKNSSNFDDEINVQFFSWLKDEFGLSSLNPKNPVHFFKLLSAIISGIISTKSFVKNNEIDACIAMWAIPSGLYAWVAKIFSKTPYFVWALGSDIWKVNQYPFGNYILNKVLKNAKTIFADGIKLAKDVEKISKRKCDFLASNRILDKTIKEIEYEKFDDSKINFIFLGRYHPNKGVDILIESIAKLNKDERNKILFHIFGGGPLEKKIKTMVKKLGIESNTFVNNYLEGSNVYSYFSKADFVIIPSRIESIPIVLSDVLQSGKPVIVTNVGDMGDLVRKYNAGIVVESNSQSLAEGIQTAIKCDKEKLESFQKGIVELKDFLDLKKSIQTFKKIAQF